MCVHDVASGASYVPMPWRVFLHRSPLPGRVYRQRHVKHRTPAVRADSNDVLTCESGVRERAVVVRLAGRALAPV